MIKGSTNPPALRRSRSPLAIAAVLAFGTAAVFGLPYFFPVSPTVSDSYLVGFNNRVCVASFLLFAAGFSWWTNGFGVLPQRFTEHPPKPSRALLYTALLLFFAYTLAEWLLLRHHPAIQEAPYFLDRLQHLAAGQAPYRDFEFAYGPLFLYLPLIFAHLPSISLSAAYFGSWILEFLLGVGLIYLCVARLAGSREQKNILFVLFAANWWVGPLCLGPNYTPFRFFLAPLSALLIAPRLTSNIPIARLCAELLLTESLLLLVSPEQALAFTGAALIFLGVFYLQTRSSAALLRLLAAAALSLLLLLPLRRTGLFDTASAMSQGAYNFPVLPNAQQLPLVFLLLVCAAALLNGIRRHQKFGPVEMLALLGYLLLPAAFGRADTGHFVINTTPAALAGFSLLTIHKRAFRLTVVTYAVCVVLLPAPLVFHYTLRAQLAAQRTAPLLAPPLTSRDAPFAPFGYPVSASPGNATPVAQTGFFFGVEDMVTAQQVQQQIRQIEDLRPSELLLPGTVSCSYPYDRHALRLALATPFLPPARHTADTRQPLCDYIHQHYAPNTSSSALSGFQYWHRTD